MIHITQNILRILRHDTKAAVPDMHSYKRKAEDEGYSGHEKLKFIESSLKQRLVRKSKVKKDEARYASISDPNIELGILSLSSPFHKNKAVIERVHQDLLKPQ